MTENEKISMEKDMHNFQKAKRDPNEIWQEFLRESIHVLRTITDAVKNNPYFPAMQDDYEEDEFYEEDAMVLYAEPGKAAVLMEEEEAIDEIIITKKASAFVTHSISEELIAVYPKDCSRRICDGSVFVAGPLYIAHPVIGDEEGANMDLTAVDFCEAMAYLAAHIVKTNQMTGFLLEKED